MSMNFEDHANPYANFGYAADAPADERADFIGKTYLHLGGAIAVFVGLEAMLFQIPGIDGLMQSLFQSRFGYLIVFGVYMVVTMLAQRWTATAVSPQAQYMGLGVFILAEAVIFLPLLWVTTLVDPNIIPMAAIITLCIFGGLSAVVYITRKNFSFLAPALSIGAMALFGLIIASFFFGGMNLSLIITLFAIVLMSGYILYETSNVLHNYQIGQHVVAALALFAALATLFWYVIRLLMILNSRD